MNLKRIKQVYVVSGEGNSGKTTLLLELCNYLRDKAVAVDDSYKLNSTDMCFKAKLSDGRVVGVGTAGDTAGLVIENFLYFSEGEDRDLLGSGCDVVFVALTHNNDRHSRRYKPNRSSAEIALYDVIFPAFMPSFTEPTEIVETKRYSQHYYNFQQLRKENQESLLHRLKGFLFKSEDISNNGGEAKV